MICVHWGKGRQVFFPESFEGVNLLHRLTMDTEWFSITLFYLKSLKSTRCVLSFKNFLIHNISVNWSLYIGSLCEDVESPGALCQGSTNSDLLLPHLTHLCGSILCRRSHRTLSMQSTSQQRSQGYWSLLLQLLRCFLLGDWNCSRLLPLTGDIPRVQEET